MLSKKKEDGRRDSRLCWFPYMGKKLILEQEGLAAVALIHSDLEADSFARLAETLRS